MNVRISLVASLVSALLLAACNSSDDDLDSPINPDGTNGSRKLKTLDNSDAFLSALRAGLIGQASTTHYYPETDTDFNPPAAPTDAVEGGGESEGSADGSGGDSGGSTDDSGNEVTSTNVQELGVDEQDWVKLSSDGNRLYVLDSRYAGNIGPIVNDVEPPPFDEGTDDSEDPAGTSEPVPDAYQTVLRMLQLDADAPDATSLRDFTVPLEGGYAEGFYLYETAGKTEALLTSNSNNFWSYWSESTAFGDQSSVITRVDVTDPDSASITGTLSVDGQIVSSRRIGKYLFFASRFYPTIPGEQPYGQSPEDWQMVVNNADVADLLPHYQLNGANAPTALIDPAGCFVAEAPSDDDYYYSPDIITLAVLDLDTLQISDSECYLGASETLYASPNAVYLATTQYDYSVGPMTEDGGQVDVESGDFTSETIWFDPRVDTDIHQFDIDAGQLVYAGTGTVPGHLGWNELRKPFRMSEQDGYLRVATINDRQGLENSPILMSVLQADGSGELKTVSSLPNPSQPAFIGKPGEQLYASRYVGDRAYLVTFRQTDPLYVIDLADPSNPSLAGELQINGYSDYLHPIDENFLLGIGRDAEPESGTELGIKLSLFDVSNPAAPSEVQSVLIGQRGTYSDALYDHRAITVQAATEQHPTRVSLGINVSGQVLPSSSATGNTVFNYYNWTYTGLHGFDIATGTDAGITFRGALIAESAGDGNEAYYPSYVSDRSVMVNDSLFYIHGARVFAAPWDDLGSPTPAR